MDPALFAERVSAWHDFYLFTGTASATLVGLLFVAISLNREKLESQPYGNARLLAYRTFYTFIYMLFIAGVMLVPAQNRLGTGLPLLGVSALGLVNTLRNMRAMARDRGPGLASLLRRFALILLAMIVLVLTALRLLTGGVDALYWLTGVILGLLTAASENAWDLIMGLDD